MSKISTRGLENNAVTGAKMRLSNAESFRARNAANSADVDLFNLDSSNLWQFTQLPKYSGSNLATESYVNSTVSAYIPLAQKGAANGVVPLDATTKIDPVYLPSYVDDVVEYANLAAFPGTGETGKIYVALNTNKTYRWSGSIYIEISPSEVNSVNGFTGNVTLTTTHISEGTNLYHTTSRARAAAVVNSTAGNETDQAASVAAMKAYVTANSDKVAAETFTLSAGDITNGYIDLAAVAATILSVVPKGFPPQHPTDDFTTSVPGSVTRLTFAGDMLTLIAGDKLRVTYSID